MAGGLLMRKRFAGADRPTGRRQRLHRCGFLRYGNPNVKRGMADAIDVALR